jgi:hypothetical protein
MATVIAMAMFTSRPCAADPIPVWDGYAGDPQHTALSRVGSLSLNGGIRWSTSVDYAPPNGGVGDLYIHYGSPLVTAANTVIVPVKTGSNSFMVEGLNGATGQTLWQAPTDYTIPNLTYGTWYPSYSPVITPQNRVYYAGAGGTIYYRDNPNLGGSQPSGQIAFYGNGNYTANPSAYSGISVSTPITTDAAGDIFFGYRVSGSNPLGLTDGIARISANGTATYTQISSLGVASGNTVAMNSAPAVTADGKTLYVAVNNGTSSGTYGIYNTGSLVSINTQTMAAINSVALVDPKTHNPAYIPDSGTASPMIDPNGDVYMGVLDAPVGSNNDRGYLLHFSADLNTQKTTGAFGWDDTPSLVPASMVPKSVYSGSSKYLLMCKYNNYYDGGGNGNGINCIAILDPNATEVDPISGQTTMLEVMKIQGVTPDQEAINAGYLSAVREWCINSAAVDPATDSILVNSEDGKLYRWYLGAGGPTGEFTDVATLSGGLGEAYTPTVIGADGTVFAIQDSTLFAVPEPGALSILAGGIVWILGRRNRR